MSNFHIVQYAPPHGMKDVIEFYGDNKTTELSKGNCRGDPTWESENLVVLKNAGGSGISVQVHHKVAPILDYCLAEAIKRCPEYKVRMLGGYCARHQRNDPTLPLSIHSYGAAFDINWDKNPMGHTLITDLPISFVNAFTEQGWEWGGSWKSLKDSMHFQFATGA
jgi:hypothetical protein